MIFQGPADDAAYNTIMLFICPISILLFAYSAYICYKKYSEKKKNAAKYLCIANIQLLIIMSCSLVSNIEQLFFGRTPLYLLLAMIRNIFIVFEAVIMFLFHCEFVQVSNRAKKMVVGFGIGVIFFMMIPQNDWLERFETFRLSRVSYMLLTICYVVVFSYFLKFFKLAKRVEEMNKSFTAIGIGAVFRILYVLLKFITVFYSPLILQVGAAVVLVLSMVSIYFGFIQPAASSFNKETNPE
ncbi:MAG: hypothetical protein GY870_00525 [archaeon]|nr:hypothetical protein [archaeon]